MAYYALHKFHWKPSEVTALDRREKAFIWGAIEVRSEAEQEQQKKAERKRKAGKSVHKRR